MANSNPNLPDALHTLKILHPDGEVFELCIISPLAPTSPNWKGKAYGKKPIVAGWFKDPEKAADLATRNEAEGIYITLNPCADGLLARANQRLKAGVDRTADNHIVRIKNLLIDIDPLRPAGISSTDQEHEAALEMAEIIKSDLTKEGWPEPLVGDSGNGGHLIYPLDLPNDPESIALVKAVLEALSQHYADELKRRNLDIDQAVFNPARLTKLYGTMVRKGDSTPDRPHRLSKIISLPEARQPVALELLKKLAATVQSQKTQAKANEAGTRQGQIDVVAYLGHYGVEVVMVKPHGESFLYCLRECLFDPSHNGNEAAIGQTAEGKLYYQCFHLSCKGRTWIEARAKISGQDKLTGFIIGAAHSKSHARDNSTERNMKEGTKTTEIPSPPAPQTPWGVAAQLFPRVPFPWETMPGDIAESLQKLGRACATSPYALPGAGFCLVGSVLGRTLEVSPKEGWNSPLIVWHGDIRESGEGKTPAVRQMTGPINEAQRKEEICYRESMDFYKRLPRKEREQQPPPQPPRGYFVSDLTLEGLRDDLLNSPHGGLAVIQDELSSFINEQNQYKAKGTDRESWLKLWDGHPARIVRGGRSMYINGARVSIFGGVQPRVFKTFFAGEDRLYLEDGTLYRFLLTCEPPTYYDLTAESWGERDREKWETVLYRALDWVNGKIFDSGGRIEQPIRMIFNSEAQGRFIEWRNRTFSFRDQLPAQLRGFLPKVGGYVLRLTGIIHCMHQFSIGRTPQVILTIDDLERGIKAVSFYLGQIQGALRLIEEEGYSPPEISERSLLLAQTLDRLRPHLQDGRLATGFIHKHYNANAPETQKIKTPKGMGAVLRAAKLNFAPGKHNANGYRSVSCLEWDKKTESFIETGLRCLGHLQSQDLQGFDDADVEEPISGMSVATERGEDIAHIGETMSAPETTVNSGQTDIADLADEDVREVQF